MASTTLPSSIGCLFVIFLFSRWHPLLCLPVLDACSYYSFLRGGIQYLSSSYLCSYFAFQYCMLVRIILFCAVAYNIYQAAIYVLISPSSIGCLFVIFLFSRWHPLLCLPVLDACSYYSYFRGGIHYFAFQYWMLVRIILFCAVAYNIYQAAIYILTSPSNIVCLRMRFLRLPAPLFRYFFRYRAYAS